MPSERRRPVVADLALNQLRTHSIHAHSTALAQWFDAIPNILAGRAMRQWRDALCTAHRSNRPVVAALGGHVIKVGCSPYLIDWMDQGIVTAVCMNGAAAIHDIELALAGHTSEDVEASLSDGSF